jgi:hypothetical protein
MRSSGNNEGQISDIRKREWWGWPLLTPSLKMRIIKHADPSSVLMLGLTCRWGYDRLGLAYEHKSSLLPIALIVDGQFGLLKHIRATGDVCLFVLSELKDRKLFFHLHAQALRNRVDLRASLVELLYYAARDRDDFLLAYIADPVDMVHARVALANHCIRDRQDNATWWWLRDEHRFLSIARCVCGAWLADNEGPRCAAHPALDTWGTELVTTELVFAHRGPLTTPSCEC